jgi:hypothetical protein
MVSLAAILGGEQHHPGDMLLRVKRPWSVAERA